MQQFFSSKVRLIYTSTVTGSHSYTGKNYAYALFHKQKPITKSTKNTIMNVIFFNANTYTYHLEK